MQTPTMPGGSVSKWRTMGGDLVAARATLCLVFLLIVIQAIVESAGGSRGAPKVFEVFGLSRSGLADGGFWQPLTYGLIHANWVHLMINGFALLAFGPRVERIGGGRLVVLTTLAGCLSGGLFHLLLGGAGNEAPILVGISGGATALLLWLTGVSPGSRMWPLAVSGKNLGLGMMIASGVLALINPQLSIPYLAQAGEAAVNGLKMDLFGVSHACHFGGAVSGWAMAKWALRPRVTLERLQKERARREAANGPQ